MLRSVPRLCRFVISPIESALNRFAEGSALNAAVVSSFLLNQTPKIESLNDYVFVHRLVTTHCPGHSLSGELLSFLATTKSGLSIEDVSSKGLSVAVSALADSGADPEFLRLCVTEIVTRDTPVPPRVISRLCKAIVSLSKAGVTIDEETTAFINTALESLDVSEMKPIEFINIVSAARDGKLQLPQQIMDRLALTVPLFTDREADVAVKLLQAVPGAEETVSALKKRLVRSRPKRNKIFKLEEPVGLPEVPKAPHYQYVRKNDLR